MATKDEREAEAKRAGSNLRAMAEAIGLTPEDFFDAVKRQCVQDRDREKITPADFVAFFHTAKQYGLDPLRKEIVIIGTKQGPRVYVAFDGWMRVLVSHPDYKAHGWRYNGWCKAADGKQSCESVTFWLARKSMTGTPYEVSEHTEFMSECYVDEDWSPWRKYRVRMLAEKAAMQGTRFFFAMYVPDLDDIQQAEAYEAGRAETAKGDAPATPAQGPIAPAAPIAGAKKSRGKKGAESAPDLALPPPDVAGQVTIEDFLKGRSEKVPVPTGADPDALVVAVVGPGGAERGVKVGDVVSPSEIADLIETAKPTDRATLPAFDSEESRRVDAALAATDPDNFEDII